MSLLKRDHLVRFGIIAIVFSLTLLMTAPPAISQPCAVPPASGGTTVLPNVLVIFDNSGSMRQDAYQGNYNPTTTYEGIFDPDKRYSYNTTNNYFDEDDPSGAWSGNFLNWISMLKVDVARQVLTGGKVYNDGTNNYLVSNTAENSATNRAYSDDSSPYQTDHHGTYYYTHWGYAGTEWSAFDVSGGGSTWTYHIKLRLPAGYEPQGLLHSIEDRVRLGLMHFNSQQGGYIRRYIHKLDSTQLNDIVSDLNRDLGDDYSGSWTPLAETLYEATRFFSQVSSYSAYGGANYTTDVGGSNDPMYNEDIGDLVWCARNYVILLTDGNSTQDIEIPAELQDYYDDELSCTPDPNPCGCDSDYDCSGTTTGTSFDDNGSAYLDDIAYYAQTTDLRSDLDYEQNITLHTVYLFGVVGVADVLLDKSAERGGGDYYRAENASAIVSALEDIFQDITEGAAAAASVALTSEAVSGTDLIYIPYFMHPDDNQWWGNIRAFELDNDGNLIDNTGGVAQDNAPEDGVLDRPIWDVDEELEDLVSANDREIFTSISNTKVAFDASTVGKYFDVDLNGNSTEESAEIDALISYIRGTDNPGGFTLRGRDNNYLGDIIHASPAFVGKPSARYDLLYGDIDYWDFYWDNDDRTQVLYAGANDGMLHCFDAANGQELWAYIPYNLLSHLKWLADPNYCHCYYVDLSATVRDIRVNGDWKSVLLGGMRLGGTPDAVDTTEPPDGTSDETLRSAFFAIDVTDPNDFIASDAVLWEISDDRFGYTTSNPIPVKVGDTDTWYLVFGSGPKTRDGEGDPTAGVSGGDGYTDNYAYIFVVNASTGDIEATIDVGALGQDNFFGPPVAIDYDLDYSVDMIYIGDAKGNLWRIKTFTGSGVGKTYIPDPNNWIIDVGGNASAPDPQPLLSLGTDQPITIKPTVSKDDNGRVWIYFGTGRYFCANDNTYCGEGNECATSGDCIESESVGDRSKFMAVGVYDRHWDSTAGEYVLQSGTLGLNDLDHRVIKQGYVVGSPGDYGYYIVDADTGQADTDVSTSTNGWYFHLLDAKERCLGDFTIYQEAVFFITFTPDDTDPCARGGLSSLYGVYYTSGTSTTNALFDLTGDENIDIDDLVTDGADLFGPAVKKLDEGFPGGGLQIKDDKGYTPLPDEPIDLNPPGDEGSTGVTSWREVLP